MLPPSGPVTLGTWRICGVREPSRRTDRNRSGYRPPTRSRSGTPDAHGLRSIAGVCVSFGGTEPLVLNGSVTYHEAAPIAWLPAAFEWPNEVPLCVANCEHAEDALVVEPGVLHDARIRTAVQHERDEEELLIGLRRAREEQRRDVDRVAADVRDRR